MFLRAFSVKYSNKTLMFKIHSLNLVSYSNANFQIVLLFEKSFVYMMLWILNLFKIVYLISFVSFNR